MPRVTGTDPKDLHRGYCQLLVRQAPAAIIALLRWRRQGRQADMVGEHLVLRPAKTKLLLHNGAVLLQSLLCMLCALVRAVPQLARRRRGLLLLAL